MLKKTITYEDFDGNTQSEDFYFNISRAEVVEQELAEGKNADPSTFAGRIQKITAASKGKDIMDAFRDLIKMSYGIRSEDGKRFIKSEQISEEFLQTLAYDELFGQLSTDANAGAEFVSGLLPKSLMDAANAAIAAQEGGKTIQEIAREQSEAQMQGFKQKEVTPEPETLQIVEGESAEDEKARKRAELEAQLRDLN